MVKKYYIHPMAFGSEQNPGYGHVEVIKYEDYTALELKVLAALSLLEDAREWSDPVSVDDAILRAIETLRGSK